MLRDAVELDAALVEHGRIVLPSGTPPSLRKAIRDTHNRFVATVFEEAREWHRDHPAKDRGTYLETLHVDVDGHAIGVDAATVITTMARNGSELVKPTWWVMAMAGYGPCNHRDMTIPVVAAGRTLARIVFIERTVTWHTTPGSAAHARNALVGAHFLDHLHKMKYTRTSGGVIVRNGTVINRFGPLGETY